MIILSVNITVDKSKVIIAEGKDDCNLINEICNFLNIHDIQTISTNTKPNSDSLKPIFNMSNFSQIVKSIGIIRDANDDPNAAFQSVSTALQNNGYPVPAVPLVPVNNGLIQTLIMIVPDFHNQGNLETLLMRYVQSLPISNCITDFFTCITQHGHNPRIISKAQVQTYLAAQRDCGMSLGVAARQRVWDFQHAAFSDLINFIRLI